MDRTLIKTDAAAPAAGPYAQAVRAGDLVFASGQLPIDLSTGGFPEGVEAQTRRSLANLSAVLEAGGASLASVVKTTVFLKGHEPLLSHECGLRRALPRRGAGALNHRGRPPAQGRAR